MKECAIVEDLLPLYIEDLVSPETGAFVRAHLEHCDSCREVYLLMTAPVQEEEPKQNYKKALWWDIAKMVGKCLLALVAGLGLGTYFFWEIGALGEQKVMASPDGSGQFVVYDNSQAGFFRRSGAWIQTPDGKNRDLRGDESFEDLDIYWAPNNEYYFAWWRFSDGDETYYWGDESVMEPDAEGNVSYSYWDRQWPQEWNFLELMTQYVRENPNLSKHQLGTIEFAFGSWAEDSTRMYFTFSTENGYHGRVCFECETKKFVLLEAYYNHIVLIPVNGEFFEFVDGGYAIENP